MSDQSDSASDKDDRFDDKLYRGLGKLGWTLPRNEDEVRAAEEWVAQTQVHIPQRLHDVPEVDRTHVPANTREAEFVRQLLEEAERRASEERALSDREQFDQDRDR